MVLPGKFPLFFFEGIYSGVPSRGQGRVAGRNKKRKIFPFLLSRLPND